MIDARLDTSGLDLLSRAFPQAVRTAEKEAVSRGGASARKLMMAFIQSGGEGSWAKPAPLTRMLRRRSAPDAPALSAFSRLVAFEVKETGGAFAATVGHSPFKARRRAGQPNLGRISINYEGFAHTITRQKRKELVLLALRKAKGARGRTRITTTKTLTAEQKAAVSEMASKLPRIGRVITSPRREMPDAVLARYGATLAAKMEETFVKHFLAGLRSRG